MPEKTNEQKQVDKQIEDIQPDQRGIRGSAKKPGLKQRGPQERNSVQGVQVYGDEEDNFCLGLA